MRDRELAIAVPAAAVLVVLAACSSSPAATSASPATSPTVSAPSPAIPVPTPTTSAQGSSGSNPSPADTGGTGRIGGPAVALPAGFAVAVGKPTRYPTSPVSTGVARSGNVLTIYTVTVRNTGAKRTDLTLTAVNAYADGEQVDGLDDTSHPTDGHFTGMLLPGKEKTAKFGFLTRKGDAGKMQVEVYVGQTGGEPAVFTDGNGAT